MVIVLLRSGGILDTHKREFIDPVDLGNFQKQPEVSTGCAFIGKMLPGSIFEIIKSLSRIFNKFSTG